MRVLFTPFPIPAHVDAMIPMAWALRTAGHEVCFAGHPDIADMIGQTGLMVVPLGDRVDNLGATVEEYSVDEVIDSITDAAGFGIQGESRTEKWMRYHAVGSMGMYFADDFPGGGHGSLVDDLVGFAREWEPDLVLWDPLNVPGAVAARASGAAHARLLFGLDRMAQMRSLFLAGPDQDEDLVKTWLTATMRRFGGDFDEELLFGQWTIDPLPPGMRLPLDLVSVPVRYTPYNGPTVVPQWLAKPAERPRVCVTLGRSDRDLRSERGMSIPDLLAGLGELDVEVIATLTAEQLGDGATVPANVRLADFVPLRFLMPTCSVVIHHGGYGTYGNAALNSVPQVVIPNNHAWDEEHIARYLTERGAGVGIEAGELSARLVTEQVARLLTDPSVKAGTARIRQELLAMPSPNDVVPVLAKLASDHRVS